MRPVRWIALVSILELGLCPRARPASSPTAPSSSAPSEEEQNENAIGDPFEPVNRASFQFNDRLYFWVLKPVATEYGRIVPEGARTGVRNFFSNLSTPVRLANCLLQAQFKGAGTEMSRFAINTTLGVAGFGDPAAKRYNLKKHNEDSGQTLGVYGLAPGFYIDWPVLGPSSGRDTLGLAGDLLLDPISYIPSIGANLGVRTYDRVNETSLQIGDYEDLKKSSLDPYVAVRDAYVQHRRYLIDEK